MELERNHLCFCVKNVRHNGAAYTIAHNLRNAETPHDFNFDRNFLPRTKQEKQSG
jgi:hypothetical protein